MQRKTKFFIGDPLCQSLDFLYAASLCGGEARIETISDFAKIDSEERFFLPLSIVDIVNLSRDRFTQDQAGFGSVFWLDRVAPGYERLIRTGHCVLLIDYSGEQAYLDEGVMLDAHLELQKRSIDPANLLLISENAAFERIYSGWCSSNGLKPMQVAGYNHALYHFSGTINVAEPRERMSRLEAMRSLRGTLRPRVFACLNNMAKMHRLTFVSYLFERGLQDRGFVSLLSSLEPEWRDAVFQDVLALAGANGISRNIFDSVVQRVPIKADAGIDAARSDLSGRLGADFLYTGSYISFVTESDFSDGSVVRFTEKVLKPIANLQPFLVVGNPGTLELLRREGFETFSPFIDETYDTLDDPAARFCAVLQEVERICRMTSSELENITNQLWDRLELNHARLWDVMPRRYANDPIHDRLEHLLNSRT